MKNVFLFLFIALGTHAFATTWDSPINLSPSPGQGAGDPRITMNDSPTGIAVWLETKSARNLVQGAIYSGGIWEAPADISTLTNNSETPQVSINSSGVGFAVWVEHVGVDAIVRASRYSGGIWEAPVDITTSGVAESPQIKINSSGNAVAVWMFENGQNYAVAGAFYSSGSWSTPTTLSVGNHADEPQAALSDGNTALAVWSESNGSDRIIQSRAYSGSWGSVSTLSVSGADAFAPQVVMDSTNNGMATWSRIGSNFYNVVQVAGYAAGSWGSPVDISDDTQEAYNPQIGLGDSGNAVAVWLQINGLISEVAASTRFSGSWSVPEVLSNSGVNTLTAAVAMNQDEQAVAIWLSGGSSTNVESSTFSSGSWDALQTLSTVDHAFSPAVTMGENEAFVVWRGLVGPSYVIQASLGIL